MNANTTHILCIEVNVAPALNIQPPQRHFVTFLCFFDFVKVTWLPGGFKLVLWLVATGHDTFERWLLTPNSI